MRSAIVAVMLGVALVAGIMFMAHRNAVQAANSDRGTNTGGVPVVVELFTSQGCSSCPPADAVLTRLANEQPIAGVEIIALAEHVDYWNRLGWTDPFSKSEFTDRQSSYGEKFGGDRIYTPQMVVNGTAEFVGSDSSRAHRVIRDAALAPRVDVKLTQSVAANNHGVHTVSFDVELPAGAGPSTNDVLLAITESNLHTRVARGENGGRELLNSVTRMLRRIGMAKPGKRFRGNFTVDLDPAWKPENLRAIVFVQEQRTLHILGAAHLKVTSAQ